MLVFLLYTSFYLTLLLFHKLLILYMLVLLFKCMFSFFKSFYISFSPPSQVLTSPLNVCTPPSQFYLTFTPPSQTLIHPSQIDTSPLHACSFNFSYTCLYFSFEALNSPLHAYNPPSQALTSSLDYWDPSLYALSS